MKAQIIGQAFLYILAIVIISIVLLFGYKSIVMFKDKTEQVAFVEMKNELVNSVKTITIDYGSVVKKELNIPSKYREVCFVKSYPPDVPIILAGTGYPAMEQNVNFGTDNNVFLVTDMADKPFDIGEITVNSDSQKFLCIPVKNGRIILRLEGKGDHTDISEW